MPLLNKFVTFPKNRTPTQRHEVYSNAHIADIVSNLQVILQSRRTTDLTHNIGLNDFNELSIDESLMHRLCIDIQQQITLLESRLEAVEVELAENGTTRWLLSVSAKLVDSRIDSSPTDNALIDKKQINFTLEVSKPVYQAAKRAVSGAIV
jgi:predicted component of type VI protein secretion system